MSNYAQVMFGVLAFALLIGPSVTHGAERRPPNIILIVADDLGYGDLGCYGQRRIKTPHLDQLAREGVRFTDFYAGSTVCAPSRCSLMTGLHQGHAYIRGNAKENLRPEDVTLAEVLKAAGYHTGLIGKWGLGHEGSEGVPTRQGFDFFFGYLDQTHAHNYYPSFLVRQESRVPLKNVVPNEGPDGDGVASERVEYSHDLFVDEALRYIEEPREGPFFLYLALTIPHTNNEAGAAGMEVPDLGEYADLDWPTPQKAHAAMITRMDRDIGRLMSLLGERQIDEQTIVLFTSDNGPHRESGIDPEFNDSNGVLNGSKRDLTDGGIRVPLIARWPGTIPANAASRHVSAFWDLMPTLAELAGGSQHVPEGIDGLSMVPALRQSREQPQHEYLYWAFYERGGGQALRMHDWKAVQQPIHSSIRLYHLASDIGEQHDVAAEHPELVAQAAAWMREAYAPSERWTFEPKKKGEAKP